MTGNEFESHVKWNVLLPFDAVMRAIGGYGGMTEEEISGMEWDEWVAIVTVLGIKLASADSIMSYMCFLGNDEAVKKLSELMNAKYPEPDNVKAGKEIGIFQCRFAPVARKDADGNRRLVQRVVAMDGKDTNYDIDFNVDAIVHDLCGEVIMGRCDHDFAVTKVGTPGNGEGW